MRQPPLHTASPLETGAAAPALRRLVIGIGNPLRGDDGAGALLARQAARWCRVAATSPGRREELAGMPPAGLAVRWVHQLTPELAADLSDCDAVLFLDAWHAPRGARPALTRLRPAAAEIQSHRLDPSLLLAISAGLYGRAPRGWLLRLPAERFGHGTALSAALRARLPEAQALLRRWLRRHALAEAGDA
jgi:hydrogenase maturation protease